MSEQAARWRRTDPRETEGIDTGALIEERRADANRLGYDLGSPALSDEVVARLTEYARYSDAHPEVRELQRHIDAGRFTWQDVADGRIGDSPPAGPNKEGLDSVRRTWERVRAGETPEDILDEHAEADEREQRWASPYNAYTRERPRSDPYGRG